MKNVHVIIIFFLIFFPLTIYYINQVGWVDADTYAFYNQTCYNKFDLETPSISKAIFHLLPCEQNSWKIFGFFLIFCIFSSFYYGAKKLLLPEKYVWVIGLSGFLVAFLWSPEDDMIAYPIIVASSFWLLSKITFKKIAIYGFIGGLLTLFVWKGAIIPMGIIFFGSIHPILSILPVSYLALGFLDRWGNSSEVVWGAGSLVNNFILIPLSFVFPKFDDKHNMRVWSMMLSMSILSFFQPKWGEYLVIPAFVLMVYFRQKLFKYENIIVIVGIIYLILFSIFILLTMVPTTPQWEVIKQAKIIQDKGGIIYNDWGVGHYFEFLGGIASHKGGYQGKQRPSQDVFFWLGFDENFEGYECHYPTESLAKGDGLLLLRCQKV